MTARGMTAGLKGAVQGALARTGHVMVKTSTLEDLVSAASREAPVEPDLVAPSSGQEVRVIDPAAMRERLGRQIWEAAGGRIVRGPFGGQFIDGEHCLCWPDIASQILGQYEMELHRVLHDITRLSPDLVVDLGCGDGYYSVGLARLLPDASVVAFDQDTERDRSINVNAERNGVAERVSHGGPVTFRWLQTTLESAETRVLLVDLEGLERELLNPDMVPALLATHMLVELHDHLATRTSVVLRERFGRSHGIREIEEGSRFPAEVPELRQMCSDERWALMSEGRATLGQWVWLTPMQHER